MASLRELHDRIKDFGKYSSKVFTNRSHWPTIKEYISDELNNKKEEVIVKYLERDFTDDYTVKVAKEDSVKLIKLILDNGYLSANLNYEQLYNGHIKVYSSYPEIKDDEGNPKTRFIDICNKPLETLDESRIIDNLELFFYQFKDTILNIEE